MGFDPTIHPDIIKPEMVQLPHLYFGSPHGYGITLNSMYLDVSLNLLDFL
jgi:hypothetical protein